MVGFDVGLEYLSKDIEMVDAPEAQQPDKQSGYYLSVGKMFMDKISVGIGHIYILKKV